jgi:nucleoid-associated protein YgaU
MSTQEKLAESLPGMFSNLVEMMDFMVENRASFDQISYGIDANGALRPAMNDMSFIDGVKSGHLHNAIQGIIEAGATISISQMQSTWAGSPDTIDKTFYLNNSLDTLTNKGYLDTATDFIKDASGRFSSRNTPESAGLQYANSVYGSHETDIERFIPFLEAQEKLATDHFDGDKVKMAQFFVEHPVTGAGANRPFADFVTSGEAGEFIAGQRKLTAQYNNASQAHSTEHFPPGHNERLRNAIMGQPTSEPEASTAVEAEPEVEADSQYIPPVTSLDNISESPEIQDILAKLDNQTHDDILSPTSAPPGQSISGPHVTITDLGSLDTAEGIATAAINSAREQTSPQSIVEKALDTARAETTPTAGSPYTVVKNDALSVIVQDAYGTDHDNPLSQGDIIELTEIVRAQNNIQNADKIYPGDKITLPSQDQMTAMLNGTYEEPTKLAQNNSTPSLASELAGLPTNG